MGNTTSFYRYPGMSLKPFLHDGFRMVTFQDSQTTFTLKHPRILSCFSALDIERETFQLFLDENGQNPVYVRDNIHQLQYCDYIWSFSWKSMKPTGQFFKITDAKKDSIMNFFDTSINTF